MLYIMNLFKLYTTSKYNKVNWLAWLPVSIRFFDAHAYLSSDGSVLLQDDPPGVEFTRRGGLSPVVRVELPVVGQNPGQVDQSLHPFVCQNYKNPKPCH